MNKRREAGRGENMGRANSGENERAQKRERKER